jgi:hypothetical protein
MANSSMVSLRFFTPISVECIYADPEAESGWNRAISIGGSA